MGKLAVHRVVYVFVAATSLFAACSPTRTTIPSAQPSEPAPSSTRAPKSLTLAILVEPHGFVFDLTQQPSRVGGIKQAPPIVHNLLTVENDKVVWEPELAAEMISVDKGTWRVNADGTMDTTWKIRPNVKWHDGTPFTSDDLVFSWRVFTDPEIPNRIGTFVRTMISATAPVPLTLVVHWSAPSSSADRAQGLIPLPKHLLEDTYLNDKANFALSPRLSTQFVGLGPYRLTSWEPGSHLEFARFDDYWRGKAQFDTIIVRFMGDPNTMVANALSGTVDVLLAPGVDLDAALDVKQRWEGTGNQVLVGLSGNMRIMDPQLRPEYARPREGLPNRTVRQALYHAIDRQSIVDVTSQGFAAVADSWIRPNDPDRRQIESAIPQYPVDPSRARQLFAQAGWTMGSDGVLVHPTSGERFEVEIQANLNRDHQRTQAIIADGWKTVGVQANQRILAATETSNEVRATRTAAGIRANSPESLSYLQARNIAAAENRWVGSNNTGYSNPRVDGLVDRWEVTMVPAERIAVARDLVQEVMGDLPLWPLNWDVTNVIAVKGIKGISGGSGTYHTWNIFEWDKE